MTKNIKKLIKQINKEDCPEKIAHLMTMLDYEIEASYTKTSTASLRDREEYENNIYNKLENKI